MLRSSLLVSVLLVACGGSAFESASAGAGGSPDQNGGAPGQGGSPAPGGAADQGGGGSGDGGSPTGGAPAGGGSACGPDQGAAPTLGASCSSTGATACDTALAADGTSHGPLVCGDDCTWQAAAPCGEHEACETASGTCKPIAAGCESPDANGYGCADGQRFLCSADRTSTSNATSCPADLCAASTEQGCAICIPKSYSCSGASNLVQCNDAGDALSVVKTCDKGKTCDAGKKDCVDGDQPPPTCTCNPDDAIPAACTLGNATATYPSSPTSEPDDLTRLTDGKLLPWNAHAAAVKITVTVDPPTSVSSLRILFGDACGDGAAPVTYQVSVNSGSGASEPQAVTVANAATTSPQIIAFNPPATTDSITVDVSDTTCAGLGPGEVVIEEIAYVPSCTVDGQ